MSRGGVLETFSPLEIKVMEKLEGSFWSQTLAGSKCPPKFYHCAAKAVCSFLKGCFFFL